MTTLTADVELTQAEITDLLAHRWTVALAGQHVDETAELLITPPPSTSTLRWYFDNKAIVTGVVVRCDTEIRRWLDFKKPISFRADDQMLLTLVLNRGDVT